MRLDSMSDDAIALEIGKALKRYRLLRNLSQDQLAKEIGVSRPTVSDLEKGQAKLVAVIAALRVLRRLDLLAALTAEPRKSPIQAVRMAGKSRVRASPSKDRAAPTARAVALRNSSRKST